MQSGKMNPSSIIITVTLGCLYVTGGSAFEKDFIVSSILMWRLTRYYGFKNLADIVVL